MPLRLHCIYKALDYRPYKIIIVTEGRAFKFCLGVKGDRKKGLLLYSLHIGNSGRFGQ
jgi:hypothetical protein